MTGTVEDALRRNFARFLAPLYLKDRIEIARRCDEEIDQTGILLGYVREAAEDVALLKAFQNDDIAG